MSHDYTLAVDSATVHGSVALLRGLEVIAARDVRMRGADEETLMPAIVACCEEGGVAPRDVARVACGEGPGSFTGLRIAASIAKGFATATGCPLFAVSSLLLTVAGAAPVLPQGRYLSVIDAHRSEYFALVVEIAADGLLRPEGGLEIVAEGDIAGFAAEREARLIGPAQEVEAWPRAGGVAALLPGIIAGGPVELVGWEPLYGRAPEAQVRWERAHGRALSG